jgi:hypothetical protein
MADDEETFADRWSRRKAAARGSDVATPVETAPETTDDLEPAEDEEDVVAALPPIDELQADSDYTPFLDRRVPKELKRMALRKLWLSDPVFANLDGLNDYDDDFRTMGLGKVVRTAYEVGRGMVTRAEKEAELAAAQAQQAADAATVDDDPTTDEDAESEIGEEDTESGENEQA